MTKNETYNRRTEDIVLSILIKDPEKLYSIMETISADMFSAKLNQTIFKALLSLLTDTGMPPSTDVLIGYLDGQKLMEDSIGENHIYALAGMDHKVTDLSFHAKVIADKYKERVLMDIATRQIPMGVENQTDISSFVADIRDKLSKLETSGIGKDVVRVSEILSDVYADIWTRVDNPGLAGIDIGLNSINELTGGFVGGSLWIIGARPSMGKTTFLIRTLVDLAKRGVPSLIVSREMGTTILTERIISAETGIHFQDIRFGRIDDSDRKKLENKFNELKKLPLFFDANLYGDINYITGIVRKYTKLHGVKVVGIDYIQLLANRDADQTAELGRISRALKLLAEDLRITILVASQLNRELERRDNKKPMLSDLRQSGNLEEDADVVFGLYRACKYETNPTTKNDIDFLCLKQRNGPTGERKLRFNEDTVTISDPKNVSMFLGGEVDAEQAEEKR